MITKLVPNQRAIKTKKTLSDPDHPYSYYNIEAMSRAMNELSASAFKLWCYFNKNRDGFEFGLSSVAVHDFCNMSRTTYSRCFQELLEKGYLIPYTFENTIQGYLFIEDGFKNDGKGIIC